MANGRVEVTNQERVMIWKPHEAKAIGYQLGPLNRDTGVQWLYSTLEQYPTASGEDLCQLVRVCATGQALRNGLLQRNMAQLGPMNWACEIAKLLWPGESAELLFLMDKQGPDENPESYSIHKCFLAQLAEKVQANAQGIWNFNVDNFKTPFYNGLNTRTKIAIGLFNPTNITWYALKEKVRLAGDLFREAAYAQGSRVKHPKKGSQEPVHVVTYAISGPHLKPRRNRRHSSFGAGKNPSGQSAESFLGTQTAVPPPTPLGNPQQAVPSAQNRSQHPETFLRRYFWAGLKEARLDMAQFNRQPLGKLALAYGKLTANSAERPQPPSPAQNRDKTQSGFSYSNFPQNNPKPNRDSAPQQQNKISDRIFLWRELRNAGADMTQYDNQPTSVLMCAFVKAMRKRKTRKMLRPEPEMEVRTRPTEFFSESPKDWQKEIEKFKTLTQKQDLEIKDLNEKNKEFQGELLKVKTHLQNVLDFQSHTDSKLKRKCSRSGNPASPLVFKKEEIFSVPPSLSQEGNLASEPVQSSKIQVHNNGSTCVLPFLLLNLQILNLAAIGRASTDSCIHTETATILQS
ncbi:uncharacterized protein LOC143822149 [Paroedura picta]|uniref:uncharacterized protein LOC143822149 n=1 Tax=Paroedura picta TaxID=143630 RepID=UPI00405658F0